MHPHMQPVFYMIMGALILGACVLVYVLLIRGHRDEFQPTEAGHYNPYRWRRLPKPQQPEDRFFGGTKGSEETA